MSDLHFQDLPTITTDVFGGKAAGLARLCRTGLPVPDGFAVSATAVDPSGWSETARSAFRARCGQLLARGRIAVRSSALGEDAADRSFAGLFQSVLGVASEEDALAAARICIASGAAERVLAYAGRADPIPVGLVVQRMVEATAAGVAFSRDPDGRDPAIVVEAAAGLGEQLVSGRVTPEQWRVYPTGLGGLDPRRARQVDVPATELPDGSADRLPDRPTDVQPAVLPAARACEIAAIARRTAEAWGLALDMEWALDAEGALWWLQARPITTGAAWRPPVVLRSSVDEDDGPISVWSNFNIRESMPDPLHPLSWSVWKATLVPAVMQAMTNIPEGSPAFARASGIDLVNGRIYFNLNAFLGAPVSGFLLLRGVAPLDERTAGTLRDLARRGILRPRRNPGALAAMLRGQLAGLIPRRSDFPGRFQPDAWLAALAACAAQIRARPPVAGLPDAALLTEIGILGQPESAVLRKGMQSGNVGVMVWTAAMRLFRPWPQAARRLATGVVGNPTTEISVGIDRLVQRARPFADRFTAERSSGDLLGELRAAAPGDAAIGAWLDELARFLDLFGHRVPREFDLATPRWSDDPTMVVELVRAGLRTERGEPLEARLARLRDEREAAVQAAIQSAGPWRRPWMRWAARAVLAWMPLREAPKHHIMQAFLRARQAAVELGWRLHARGVLEVPDDVFFLEIEDLEAIVLRGQPAPADLAARRRNFESWRNTPPADVIRSDGVPADEAAAVVEPGALVGHGIGGGIGEGPVKILDAPDPRQVNDGDVLVVTFADPAWTPLFMRASAVVMEVGGTMCHAAVVARELGIPAVFAVRDAKTRLVDGERVRVDGDAGRVIRLTEGR